MRFGCTDPAAMPDEGTLPQSRHQNFSNRVSLFDDNYSRHARWMLSQDSDVRKADLLLLLRKTLRGYPSAFFELDQLTSFDRLSGNLFKSFHATARPANSQSIDLRLIVQPEIKSRAVLRRKAGTGRHQPHLLLSSALDCDQSTDCVAITLHALQIHCQPIAFLADVVAQQHGARPSRSTAITGIVIDNDVEVAVIVKVGGGHAPTVSVVVGSDSHRNVGELKSAARVRAFVTQKHVVLIPVPGNITAKCIAKKLAGFVFFNVRDRAQNVRQSKIVFLFAANPTVDGIDVLAAVIIKIKHRRAPEPAERIGAAGFGYIYKFSFAVIDQ